MKKITVFYLFFIMLFFTANRAYSYFDMSVPVEGDSIANDTLQFNVIKEIYKKLSVLNSACSDYSIKDTQLMHYPYDVKKKNDKYISGYWNELWTVDICGQYQQVPVTFYINKKSTEFKTDINQLTR